MGTKQVKRHDRIVQLVQERGSVSVGALADLLDVSTQTVRRDLDVLCDGETLRRMHGRIELAEDRLNTPFDQRAVHNLSGKTAIAAAVAAKIPDGATLAISIGSTAVAVAQALRDRRELTVITNNLGVAMALSGEVSNRIVLPGGELRLPDRDFIGADVIGFFGRYRTEYAIFGVAGVGLDGGLLEFHEAEIRAAQRMAQSARMSILAIDHSKFGRHAPALGGTITDVDLVVCDRPPTADFAPLVEGLGARIHFAEGPDRP
ncbi:DeoR/GlpR family DNA-binding transcription regulator [Palleronia caenipelagi]|uniref:DeoR/GlpR transcriptional regulator n=1 Tax=Palleronia caenipelagi TaxID=2489174 RepID=A0A547Q910_9RHOB|nr:DeoR/GlpR family DNA-binding transcription regulator [Palleronia caenipelagi]TRD22843.1 DeoR/GlpR transcriptional regulator [Palleronia caenipelagi]